MLGRDRAEYLRKKLKKLSLKRPRNKQRNKYENQGLDSSISMGNTMDEGRSYKTVTVK